jgi:multiple sugar transport system ATP-binding protein
MATVTLKNVYKYYEKNEIPAVADFNLEIKDKEFVVFVGPSGCGKSTTLRMIAGLEEITAGEIYIGSRKVNEVEPKDRDIAMVFQNYALYPHMTVYNNMAFGLKMGKFPYPKMGPDGKQVIGIDERKVRTLQGQVNRMEKERNRLAIIQSQDELAEMDKNINELQMELRKAAATPVPLFDMKHMPKAEIDKRVKDAAQILGITEYLGRKPKALSGGQRQRVAIGRAIVRNPKVFLMDEPLSNLDAKLRNTMRGEILLLRKKINTTFIYVTHDQIEAMTLGDRIVIMRDGFIQQVGTPQEVFDDPTNLFVAGFIGTPQMNFIDSRLVKLSNGKYAAEVYGKNIVLSDEKSKMLADHKVPEIPLVFGIRPEHITLCKADDPIAHKAKVDVSEMMGSEIYIHATPDFAGAQDIVVRAPTINLSPAERKNIVDGGDIYFKMDEKASHLFDKADEVNIFHKLDKHFGPVAPVAPATPAAPVAPKAEVKANQDVKKDEKK